MQAPSRPDFALVWKRSPNGRRRLTELLEIYATALNELRAMRTPGTAGLIATLESLFAAASRERRYLDAAEHARRRLNE
jgi:hypothetical protein